LESRQLITSDFGPPLYIRAAVIFKGAASEKKSPTALQLFRLAVWRDIRR
jgi:hypothetical protein